MPKTMRMSESLTGWRGDVGSPIEAQTPTPMAKPDDTIPLGNEAHQGQRCKLKGLK